MHRVAPWRRRSGVSRRRGAQQGHCVTVFPPATVILSSTPGLGVVFPPGIYSIEKTWETLNDRCMCLLRNSDDRVCQQNISGLNSNADLAGTLWCHEA